MKATVSRHAHFNAAHRLHIRDWSDKKNQEFFGLCNNNNFHGHNYELIVSVKGEIDPMTGYVFDMKELSNIIKIKVPSGTQHGTLLSVKGRGMPVHKTLNIRGNLYVKIHILIPQLSAADLKKIKDL